jgi:hypothetical protein
VAGVWSLGPRGLGGVLQWRASKNPPLVLNKSRYFIHV